MAKKRPERLCGQPPRVICSVVAGTAPTQAQRRTQRSLPCQFIQGAGMPTQAQAVAAVHGWPDEAVYGLAVLSLLYLAAVWTAGRVSRNTVKTLFTSPRLDPLTAPEAVGRYTVGTVRHKTPAYGAPTLTSLPALAASHACWGGGLSSPRDHRPYRKDAPAWGKHCAVIQDFSSGGEPTPLEVS